VRGPWLESYNWVGPRVGVPSLLQWSFANPGPSPARELERACFGLEGVADVRPHLWDPDLTRWLEPEMDG